jgi:hypothetical protein
MIAASNTAGNANAIAEPTSQTQARQALGTWTKITLGLLEAYIL